MAEAAILEQCRLHPDGIPDAELADNIGHIPVADRAQAINALLSSRKLQIFKDGDTIVYREVKQDEAVKCVAIPFPSLSLEPNPTQRAPSLFHFPACLPPPLPGLQTPHQA
jgi:hypothetical protein